MYFDLNIIKLLNNDLTREYILMGELTGLNKNMIILNFLEISSDLNSSGDYIYKVFLFAIEAMY